jgi:(1->4)-alpha-D-glucan 1-alpha-D-glucosylmutase
VVTPVSTYRLQLTPDFGFAAAAAQAPYLASLGLSHIYLSPVLQAAPGSTHGYDVTDHSRISADLGGEDGFREMAARFREAGLGIVVDVVPNHMAIPVPEHLNRQLWTVLRDGPGAAFAHWFDIDWAAEDGRMLLPILGGPADECLDELSVDRHGGPDGEPVLRYYDHEFPLREGTLALPLPELLGTQYYRLAYWREASRNLNWRRFFDIATLIGVRVEDPDVFDVTHEVVLRLLNEGLIDGLRIDHPDGLADPRGYLRRLDAATGGRWTVVEKILEADERLPGDWPCAGTTGYDVLRVADGLFTDSDGADPMLAEYQRFAVPVQPVGSQPAGSQPVSLQSAGPGPAGPQSDRPGRPSGQENGPATFAEVALTGKREVTTGVLAAEVARLARAFTAARPGTDPGDARQVLAEVLAAFGVYRAYVHRGEPVSQAAEQQVGDAVTQAKKRLPDSLHSLADAVGDLALGGYPQAGVRAGDTGEAREQEARGGAEDQEARGEKAGAQDAAADFVIRFGQTTGPVLAKGIEDTASYRWPRLLARNEVGGDPDRFAVPPAEFHAFAARLAADWPASMTTLSTHDTKRAEDVRARLAVLSEMPAEWGRRVAHWHTRALALLSESAVSDPATDQETGDPAAIDPATAYLLWQTVIGAWPLSAGRLTGYLTKAMREAKTRTSWITPDEQYENAVRGLAELALSHPELRGSIESFVGSIAADAAGNSLAVKLIQLTMPGVPDVYQGCELTALSLVDPDNRRPVDFGRRQELLRAIDAGDAPGALADLDAAKLLVTSRTLRLRREHPDWFLAGDYHPLAATGPAADHVVAFARAGQAVTVVTRLPRGLRARDGWGITSLNLPAGPSRWRDILTGRVISSPAPLDELMASLPVALLIPESGRPADDILEAP